MSLDGEHDNEKIPQSQLDISNELWELGIEPPERPWDPDWPNWDPNYAKMLLRGRWHDWRFATSIPVTPLQWSTILRMIEKGYEPPERPIDEEWPSWDPRHKEDE